MSGEEDNLKGLDRFYISNLNSNSAETQKNCQWLGDTFSLKA